MLLWALDLDITEALDSLMPAADPTAIDLDAARADLKALERRRARWLEMYGDGLVDRPGLDRHLADLDAERADLERQLDPTGDRATIAANLDALLATTIETDGRDPQEWEDPPPGSAQWRHLLKTEALSGTLSEWAIGEVARLASAVALKVTLTPSDDWRHPVVDVDFDL